VTVAVKVAELPGSTLLVAGPLMVIAEGGGVDPPQPVSAEVLSVRRRAGKMPNAKAE
jgi:hypothetical protein